MSHPFFRLTCRDIGGSDPERMAAPRVAEYVTELFKDSPVQVEQTYDVQTESLSYSGNKVCEFHSSKSPNVSICLFINV